MPHPGQVVEGDTVTTRHRPTLAANRRWPAPLRLTAGVTAAYFVVGLVGMALAVPPSNATLIFPAAGLAVATALRYGAPAVWGVGLGQFLMQVIRHVVADGPPSALLLGCWAMISLGAALQALMAVFVVRRWKGPKWRAAIYEQHTFGFLFLSGVLACLVSASFGIGTLAAAGFVEPAVFGRAWLNWYTGDTLGVFIFAPLTLLLLHGESGRATAGDWHVVWRMGAILALIMVAFFGVRRWEAWAREATLRSDALAIAGGSVNDGIEAYLTAHPLPAGLRVRVLDSDGSPLFDSADRLDPPQEPLTCTVPVPGTDHRQTLVALADDTYLQPRFDVSWMVAILSLVVAGILADRDFVVLSAITREATTRIEKERIQRNLAIARDIQQGLLPTMAPDLPGFDIAGWNEPADETGGDYFDFVPLADGRLAVAIADVTGHGIGAALVVAEVRALFRAEIVRAPDLRAAVANLHGLLAGDLSADRFATACFAIVSAAHGTVSTLSAGHGPIMTYTAANDEVRELPPQGLPLGFMPEAAYTPPHVVALAPGDIFMLLTDGFFEWSDPSGEPFGVPRIRDFLRSHHRRSARGLIDELRAAVVAFSGGVPQADDLTAVVVKRLS